MNRTNIESASHKLLCKKRRHQPLPNPSNFLAPAIAQLASSAITLTLQIYPANPTTHSQTAAKSTYSLPHQASLTRLHHQHHQAETINQSSYNILHSTSPTSSSTNQPQPLKPIQNGTPHPPRESNQLCPPPRKRRVLLPQGARPSRNPHLQAPD